MCNSDKNQERKPTRRTGQTTIRTRRGKTKVTRQATINMNHLECPWLKIWQIGGITTGKGRGQEENTTQWTKVLPGPETLSLTILKIN